jgi:putative DNA primase/helicase
MTESFREYVEHNKWALVPILPGQKGPKRRGWNLRENTITDPKRAEGLKSAGLCHAYSGTCALDVDRWDEAQAWLDERGIDLLALRSASDAVQIISGQANRGKLLYLLPEPLPSKTLAEGAFELRSGTSTGRTTQDVLPPSQHPSGREYRWEGDWRKLPPIPDALLKLWKGQVAPKTQLREVPVPSAGLDELRNLLSLLDPECGYDDWITVGMATHHETAASPDGLGLWNEWSAKGTRYIGLQDLQSHWDSFGQSSHPKTIASLRRMAVASADEFDVVEGESDTIAVMEGAARVSPHLLKRITAAPTEDSVAELFEVCFRDEMRYCSQVGGWLHWDGARWTLETTGLALDYCRRLARRVNLEKKAHISRKNFAKGVEDLARASRRFAIQARDWDLDEFLLNTPEFTVDLRTGERRPHRREDHITKVTQVSPKAGPMPHFDQFMRDITQDDQDLIAYHQRSLGACLSGAINEHFLLFWFGKGRNGKNTLGDLVCKILGDYGKVIPSTTLMASRQDRHPTELANLMGLRLAISSEVPEGAFWNEALIKSITGDETLSARRMRQDFFEFRRTHKHLIFGNYRPILRVVDDGIRTRLHIVPFKAKFVGAKCDAQMGEKLRAEAPQILNWLLEGHKEWMNQGQQLRRCGAVEEATEDYFDSQSTTEAWLDERCVLDDPGNETRSSDLYDDYVRWKGRRGERPVSTSRWGEFMGSRFTKRKSNGWIYQGIALREVLQVEEFERFAELL